MLLTDIPVLGKQGDLVYLVAERARRLIESGKVRLEPPDQELTP